MKRMRIFGSHCLCFGLLAFLPLSVQAKQIEVTFDAGKYQNAKDWRNFIVNLCETLRKVPNRENCDTFYLNVKNGGIFGTEANGIADYFQEPEQRERILAILEKVQILEIAVSEFSTQSLGKVFPKCERAYLASTKTITGTYGKCKLLLGKSLETPSDWSSLIEHICKELLPYADDERISFMLRFKHGRIFADDPGDVNYGDYYTQKKEPTSVTKILSKIFSIDIDAEVFSTLSLTKVFPWAKILSLPNAEYIYGFSQKISQRINMEEANSLLPLVFSKNLAPQLHSLSAPKVTKIANAAFFNFRNLRNFNAVLPVGTEHPTIVCTPLAKDYFTQRQSPANAIISPVEIRYVINQRRNVKEKYEGKSVAIGACAFSMCCNLDHVSARASFIGFAAFACSGLESVYLLLSKPSCEESVSLGDDVFFNCFGLKECFMMAGEKDSVTVDSAFNGFFWNCFALETVCIPNINIGHGSFIRSIGEEPQFYAEGSTGMFSNCFSLREIDLRSFEKGFTQMLPYWLVRCNWKLVQRMKDWDSWLGSAIFGAIKPSESLLSSYPKDVRKYVDLCLQATDKPVELFQDPDALKFRKDEGKDRSKKKAKPGKEEFKPQKQQIYADPYCNIKFVFPRVSSTVESHFRDPHIVWRAAGRFSYKPGDLLYCEDMYRSHPVLSRFNDACLKWFVYKEKLPPEEEEIVPFEKEKEEKPKYNFSGRKRKRTNFLLHGG